MSIKKPMLKISDKNLIHDARIILLGIRLPYLEILIKNGIIQIQQRPRYCNRGAFLVKVFPEISQTDLHIDGSDLFPHYYFKFENMMSEILEWAKKKCSPRSWG